MEQPDQLQYHIYRDYEVLGKVGRGTYGIVYKVVHKRTRQILAIKKIIDAFQNLIDAKRTYRELNYLLQLDHPAVVRLHNILLNGRRGAPQQPSTTRLAPQLHEIRGCNTDKLAHKPSPLHRHVYAVFELVETDLRMALKRCSQLQVIQRKFIAYQLLHGIAYLHRSGLIHRDIKPQNLLINPNKLELKICDFGMARLQASSPGSEGVLTEYVASRWYRPPQALLGISTCEPAIDLWSVGCVLAELALKTPLFAGKSTLDQLQVILRCIGMPAPTDVERLPSEEAQYVLRNFSFSRKTRFRPLADILSMCSSQEIDLITQLLTFDPLKRISAENALKHSYFDEVKKLAPELDKYSRSIAKISDIIDDCLVPQSEERIQNSNPGVQHYRYLVQELEKYAQKSINRSEHFNNQIEESASKIVHFNKKEHQGQSGLKEKSTKESGFVIQNKQHFASPNKPIIQEQKNSQFNAKNTKIINNNEEQAKKTIQKSQKNIYTKCAQLLKQKSRRKIQKQSKSKKEGLISNKQLKKQKSPLKVQKKQQTTKMVMQRRDSKPGKQKVYKFYIDKNKKRLSQLSSLKPKKATTSGDSQSFISINSNGSIANIKSHSKQKRRQIQHNITSKEQMLKRLVKPGINVTKTKIGKCKSSHNVNYFKK